MNTLTITREHLDKYGYYIGPDVTNYDGDIVLEANLGVVKFKTNVSVSGSIIAKPGTGIRASGYIEAGRSIKSSASIEAGYGIQAGESIEVNGNIKSGESIEAGEYIEAGGYIIASAYIKAGYNIEAGGSILSSGSIEADESIKSGWVIRAGKSIFAKHAIDADASIEAGDSIKAGIGIRAGLSIDCKTLSAGLPIFAGTATWVRPEKEQTQIRCEQLCGTVAYGELILKTKEPTRHELQPCPLCGAEVKIEQHFAAPFFNIECACGLAVTGALIGDQAEPPVYWVSDDKGEDVHSTKSGTVVAIFSHYENMPENYRQAFDSLVEKWNQRWLS